MKEPRSEGVANHTDPESCGESREGLAEALTGESTGREIEPGKKSKLRDADALMTCRKAISADKHGGAIRVRSNTDGPRRGTTISVLLPADPTAHSQSAVALLTPRSIADVNAGHDLS
jgi:hypothetical protein